MSTLFASFTDPHMAEKAAGALLDEGANAADISVIANEHYAGTRAQVAEADVARAEQHAKEGISTTTPADAAMGAAKGLTIGTGVGIVAALASLLVPGVGLVLGTGALAMAVGGAIGTAVAGAAAGGVVGYLKDQGVGENMISHYSQAFTSGGAILAVAIPTGKLDTNQVEGILLKYGAANVASYAAANTVMDRQEMPPKQILVVDDNPNIDPIGIARTTVPVEPVVATEPGFVPAAAAVAPPVTSHVVDPVTGTSEPIVPLTETEVPVVSRAVDPVTGVPTTSEVNPLTGTTVSTVPVSAVRPTRIDPVTGQALEGFVTDPVTGSDRAVRIENGQVVYVL